MAVGGAVWFRQYTKVVPPEIPQEMRTAMLHSQLTGRQEAEVESLPQPVQKRGAYTLPFQEDEEGTAPTPTLTQEGEAGAVDHLLAARRVTTHSDKEYWVTLSDGTLVHLNYNTRVIYPEKFEGKTRDVILDGEAYFMVAKDRRHPFIVHTQAGDVRVYGTHFNVSARTEQTEVVLVEGSVGVTPTSGSEQMLKPGQMATLNAQESAVNCQDVDVEPYIAWNTGTFIFEDCPLSQLMDVLSKWYGFKIAFQSSEAREKHFTGEIDRYGSIHPTLEAISQVTGLSLYVHDGKIVIE